MGNQFNQNPDDDVIEFKSFTGATLTHDYLRYSHWRIKQILKEYYDAKLEPIWGYKCGRKPGYVTHYNIVSIATGEIISKNITLDMLRRVFAKYGFSLSDDKRV